MANVDDEAKILLKVMVNKENNKVLYAEADSDFADVLLSFLTLPLGKIVRLMEINRHVDEVPVFGSLTVLLKSLDDVDEDCFSKMGSRLMLSDPPSSFSDECCKLKINVYSSMPERMFFLCGNMNCGRMGMYHYMHLCDCGQYMNQTMCMMGPQNEDGDGGVFIKKGLSFLITDDLRMMQVVPGSILQTLLCLGVAITDGAKLRTVSLELSDILDLLRASFQSSTPLSDLIFHRTTNDICNITEDLILDESSSDFRNMIVKAWVRNVDDSNLHLFVLEAGGDFVDFLFSLLVVPLGAVEWLLGGDSGLRSIDNLYQSVQDLSGEECFRELNMKSRLMKPKLPPYCLSKNQMFPLEEEDKPKICFIERATAGDRNANDEFIYSWPQFKDPKGGESYVKSSAAFFIDPNLHVYDFCEADTKHLKIDPNYKKLELHIGSKEALLILKASLRSVSAAKESLANLILEKFGS